MMTNNEFRRRLLEEAPKDLPEDNVRLLGDNFEFIQTFRPDAFLPMPSFHNMFDSLTSAFRDFSPHYDNHFNFISSANDRLENPYNDVSLHIYVQNSMVNDNGEVITENFECSDGFPNDLQSSCQDLKKETVEGAETEENIETEVEQMLEEVESELTNLEQFEADVQDIPPMEQAEAEE